MSPLRSVRSAALFLRSCRRNRRSNNLSGGVGIRIGGLRPADNSMPPKISSPQASENASPFLRFFCEAKSGVSCGVIPYKPALQEIQIHLIKRTIPITPHKIAAIHARTANSQTKHPAFSSCANTLAKTATMPAAPAHSNHPHHGRSEGLIT